MMIEIMIKIMVDYVMKVHSVYLRFPHNDESLYLNPDIHARCDHFFT